MSVHGGSIASLLSVLTSLLPGFRLLVPQLLPRRQLQGKPQGPDSLEPLGCKQAASARQGVGCLHHLPAKSMSPELLEAPV